MGDTSKTEIVSSQFDSNLRRNENSIYNEEKIHQTPEF
jgi:hypothetical protein